MILRGTLPGIAGADLRARSWLIVSRGTRVFYPIRLLRFHRFRCGGLQPAGCRSRLIERGNFGFAG